MMEYYITLDGVEAGAVWAKVIRELNEDENYDIIFTALFQPNEEEVWIESYREVVRENPFWPARRRLFQLDMEAGRIEQARAFYKEFFPYLFEEELNLFDEEGLRNYHRLDRAKAAVEVAEIERRSGNQERANRLADKAWEFYQHLPRMGWRWNSGTGYGIHDAMIFAIKGENERALHALREAAEAGYREWFYYESPIFESLYRE